MKITEQYSFNDGEYVDFSPYEVVQYMIEQEMEKEYIIGDKLNILKLEQCIPEKIIDKMKDVVYGDCPDRFDEQDWLEGELSEIWGKFKEFEMFYDSGKYYTITEEDYNEVIKDL